MKKQKTIIKTVVEHNQEQTSRCMMYENKNGSLKKGVMWFL